MTTAFNLPPESIRDCLLRYCIARAFLASRRIDMLSEYWALVLIDKYGKDGAIARCREKLIACARHSPGVRSRIWINVYRRLRPPSEWSDRYFRA